MVRQLEAGEGALAELVDEAAASQDAVHIAVARPPPLNCLPSNSPGEREGGNGFALAGAAGGSGFRRSRSSDMEEACCGHVINGPKNCWLSLYVLD